MMAKIFMNAIIVNSSTDKELYRQQRNHILIYPIMASVLQKQTNRNSREKREPNVLEKNRIQRGKRGLSLFEARVIVRQFSGSLRLAGG